MSDHTRTPIRVLQLLADPRRSEGRPIENPYTSLLISSLPPERVITSYFRWRSLLTERFDVLHVHWPENSLRHPSPVGRAVKMLLFAVFLIRLRVQRKAVVRTLHNVEPHEQGSRVERWLLARLESLTTLWIVLNEATPAPDSTRTVLIPHGHYRGWYTPSASAVPVPGRLVNFGMIRPYKGTEALIAEFCGIDDRQPLSLHVIGEPSDSVMANRLSTLAEPDPRVHLELRFVDDEELADELVSAELVVLPYRAMHNSGAALLALSLDRPVVVPSSAATELLVDEVGADWVLTYSGSIDSTKLLELIERARSAPRFVGPDLSRREWPRLGLLLADAYDRAVSLARGHERRAAPGGSDSSDAAKPSST